MCNPWGNTCRYLLLRSPSTSRASTWSACTAWRHRALAAHMAWAAGTSHWRALRKRRRRCRSGRWRQVGSGVRVGEGQGEGGRERGALAGSCLPARPRQAARAPVTCSWPCGAAPCGLGGWGGEGMLARARPRHAPNAWYVHMACAGRCLACASPIPNPPLRNAAARPQVGIAGAPARGATGAKEHGATPPTAP
jgi:hypothetical protein